MHARLGNDNDVDKTSGSSWGSNAEGRVTRGRWRQEINKTVPM